MKNCLKNVLVTIIALLICPIANARELQDVVYLKNGSIIRGIIIEQIPNQSLKIQTNDGSLFVYEITDIAKITKEEPIVINNKPKRHAGYKGFFDVGGGIGIRDFGDNIFSISTSHGYQFSPYFFLGAGIGVEYHTKWEATFMPIFADMRGYFLKGNVTPFIGAKAGYSPYKGKGVYFNPTIGVSFFVFKEFAMNVTIGYNLQHSKIYWYDFKAIEPWHTWEIIDAITFKIGLEI